MHRQSSVAAVNRQIRELSWSSSSSPSDSQNGKESDRVLPGMQQQLPGAILGNTVEDGLDESSNPLKLAACIALVSYLLICFFIWLLVDEKHYEEPHGTEQVSISANPLQLFSTQLLF